MRIAMVDPAAYSLPYDSELCAALAAHGHDVTLYTTRFAHGAMPEARGFQLREFFYRRDVPGLPRRLARGIQHPLDLRRLRRELRASRPDVVHVQWTVVDRLDIPFWRSLDLPVVLTAHNAAPREEGARRWSCEALAAFDAVVVHSGFGERALRAGCDDLPPIWRIPHGALDAYRDAPPPATAPVELAPGPLVAMPGLLRPYKGLDVLLEAWPRVRDHVPNAQLLVAGRPMGVELPADPPAGVTFLPRFLDEGDFAWILGRADVVCLPYRAIDQSGVLFSALAMGTPLVLTDVGGFGELRGHGAELVPPGDPAALAAALSHVLGDPAARDELARQARRAASEVYAWDAIARTYDARYRELVA